MLVFYMLQRCVYIYFSVIYVSVIYVWGYMLVLYIMFGVIYVSVRHVRTRPEVKGRLRPHPSSLYVSRSTLLC